MQKASSLHGLIFLSLLLSSSCSRDNGISGVANDPGGDTSTDLVLENGMAATGVIGQSSFTDGTSGTASNRLSSVFSGMIKIGSKYYVSDSSNHRILGYNSLPTSGASADFVIGQTDFVSSTSASTSSERDRFNSPRGIATDGTKLIVVESGSTRRVMIFNTAPTASGLTSADVILNSGGTNTCTASTLTAPEDAAIAGNKLIVSDYSCNRILIWNTIPTADDTAANSVLGQTTLTGSTSGLSINELNGPVHLWSNGSKLMVSDTGNNRVLIWDTIPTTNGADASLVLGASDFTTAGSGVGANLLDGPSDIFSNGTYLLIADENNSRVLVWKTFPTTNGQSADVVLGQPDMTSNTDNGGSPSESDLNYPTGVYVEGQRVYVTDTGVNRIVYYE